MNKSLNGLGIALTRPYHQTQSLRESIEQIGGSVFLFPLLDILPQNDPSLAEIFKQVSSMSAIIFSSPNAVSHSMRFFQTRPNCSIFAIGSGTQTALNNAGFSKIIRPKSFNSEGVLDLPELAEVNNKNILLIRGIGGRTLLAETLRKRGACVYEAAVYERRAIDPGIEQLRHHLEVKRIQIIACTSEEALEHLVTLAKLHGAWVLLKHVFLLVSSERLAEVARRNGLNRLIMAKDASDASILDALIHHHRQGRDQTSSLS